MTNADQNLAGPLGRLGMPGRPTVARAAANGQSVRLRRRKGVVALEFAILAIPFCILMMIVFELSYDLFTQEVLDNSLRISARQLQTGNAQNVVDGPGFVANYLCPAMNGLLVCASGNANVLVNVQQIAVGTDFHDVPIPQGVVPQAGGVLVDNGFVNTGSFCNVTPRSFVQVSVIYVGPTFIGHLLPGIMSLIYHGQTIHATLSTIGFSAEQFSPDKANPKAATLCPFTAPNS